MASDVSDARQRLRDLARASVETARTINFDGMEKPVEYTFVLGKLGEVAGPLFVAIQAVLTVAEELRTEADGPINPNLFDWQAAGIELVKQAQGEAADRIEAAVLKALTS